MKLGSAFAAALTLATLGVTGAASATTTTPYPNVGTLNTATYNFMASATGDLMLTFEGGDARYDNAVGVLNNGVLLGGGYVADNKTSTIGQIFDVGHVTSGDTLILVLDNKTLGTLAYSDPSMNVAYDNNASLGGSYTGGHQHVYSTSTAASTYVGFEDKPYNAWNPASDHDYNDEQVSFAVSAVSAAPEPSVWLLMIAGVGVAGMALRRRGTPVSASAA